jgi:hypothetical protein
MRAHHLNGLFPEAVIEPVRLHVSAKRYLCYSGARILGQPVARVAALPAHYLSILKPIAAPSPI